MARLLLLLCAFLFWCAEPPGGPAFGGTITYQTANLPDDVPGEDRWQFRYTLQGFSFAANEGFSIIFERELFASLGVPSGPDNSWSLLVFQPDLNLPEDGLFDALALMDHPSVSSPFSVEFVYLGAGAPSSQSFAVYRLTAGDGVIDYFGFGFTEPEVNAVPEPGGRAAVVLAIALTAAAAMRRHGIG